MRDVRKIVTVDAEDFLMQDFLDYLLANGPVDHELAFHSTVELDSGDVMHIPMVDMSTTAKAHLLKLRPFLGHALYDSFSWFSSGRSFHGYGGVLLNKEQWVSLMGALLLSNHKDMKPTVDPRWIGHRLMAGYSALRWTTRTNSYIHTPMQLEHWSFESTGEGYLTNYGY